LFREVFAAMKAAQKSNCSNEGCQKIAKTESPRLGALIPYYKMDFKSNSTP